MLAKGDAPYLAGSQGSGFARDWVLHSAQAFASIRSAFITGCQDGYQFHERLSRMQPDFIEKSGRHLRKCQSGPLYVLGSAPHRTDGARSLPYRIRRLRIPPGIEDIRLLASQIGQDILIALRDDHIVVFKPFVRKMVVKTISSSSGLPWVVSRRARCSKISSRFERSQGDIADEVQDSQALLIGVFPFAVVIPK